MMIRSGHNSSSLSALHSQGEIGKEGGILRKPCTVFFPNALHLRCQAFSLCYFFTLEKL